MPVFAALQNRSDYSQNGVSPLLVNAFAGSPNRGVSYGPGLLSLLSAIDSF
jgi:hypothetical protein